MRAPALVVVALSLAALVGTASAGRVGNDRSLAVGESIGSISASGGRVAIQADDPNGGCGRGLVWTPSSGAVTELKDPCSADRSFVDLTLAGDTAIWWDYDSGNHVYCDDVYTASVASPKAHGLGICDGTMGDTYFELAGDRTIVTVSDYTVCEADCVGDNGGLLPDGDYGVEVRRLHGGKLATLLGPVDFRNVLDARNWHVAVIEPKGRLSVYDSAGKLLWQRAGVRSVLRGRLAGSSVVVQQPGAVQVYAPGGAALRTWSLPRGAYLEDAAGGLAVYTAGSTVHLLRLADGRDRKLVTAKGLVQAQITPAGVFYAAGSSVTFVPIRTALLQLG